MTETPWDDAPRIDDVEGAPGEERRDIEREDAGPARTDVEGAAFGDDRPAGDLTPDDSAIRGT